MPTEKVIAIDLGGTQLRAALIENGKILKRAALKTDAVGGPKAVMVQIKDVVSSICDNKSWGQVRAIGISAPGPLDSDTGQILSMPTLPNWEDYYLRDAVSKLFNKLAILENDAIAAAYGEWKYGAGLGLQHLVYVTVSTGIGGGVVVDGQLLHGRRGMASHVGHFRMDPNGPVCPCGMTGCFEAIAAGTAMNRYALLSANANPLGYLGQKRLQGSVSAIDIVEGARQKDKDCLALIAQEAEDLGAGFTSLIHLYSPEKLIMGGGMANAFDLLSEGIHSVIAREAMSPFKNVPVVTAALGDNAGLIGAAALAIAKSNRE